MNISAEAKTTTRLTSVWIFSSAVAIIEVLLCSGFDSGLSVFLLGFSCQRGSMTTTPALINDVFLRHVAQTVIKAELL